MSIDLKLKSKLKVFQEIDKEMGLKTQTQPNSRNITHNEKVQLRDYNKLKEIIGDTSKGKTGSEMSSFNEPSHELSLIESYSIIEDNIINQSISKKKQRQSESQKSSRSHIPTISEYAKNLERGDSPIHDRLFKSLLNSSHLCAGKSPCKRSPSSAFLAEQSTNNGSFTNLDKIQTCSCQELDKSIFTFQPKISEFSKLIAEHPAARPKEHKNKRCKNSAIGLNLSGDFTPSKKKLVSLDTINNIYNKGVSMIKSKQIAYIKHQQVKNSSYRQFPFRPQISAPLDSTATGKLEGNFLNRQARHSVRSRQMQQKLNQDDNTEFKKVYTFSPNIKKEVIDDDEKTILRNIEKINEYVSNRRRNIQELEKEKLAQDKTRQRSFIVGERKIIIPDSSRTIEHSPLINNRPSLQLIHRKTFKTESFFDDELNSFETLSKLNTKSSLCYDGKEYKEAVLYLNKLLCKN